MGDESTDVIRCRCDKRHPLGTEWCSCGAYLPHDGTIVAAAAPPVVETMIPTDETPAPPQVREAAAFEPTEPVEQPRREAAMVQQIGGTREVADAFEPDLIRSGPGGPSVLDDRPARPDDRICPRPDCHTRNDAVRTFCRRCGADLLSEHSADTETKLSWWRKLTARFSGGDARSSAMKAQSGFRQVKGLSTRARMFRTALLGGALGAVGIGLVPGLRSQVMRQVKDVTLVDRYSYVDIAEASSPAEPIAGWEPALIADATYNRAWGEPWGRADEGMVFLFEDQGCVTGSFPTIRLELADRSDVDRARLWAGTWDGDEARGLLPRPRVLQVRALTEDGADDTCQFIEIEDDPEPQVIELGGNDLLGIELRVIGVFLGDGNNDLVAISEIWLENGR